jgi:cardiolipin synthase A/B
MEIFISSYTWLFRNIIWINIAFAILLVFFERRNPTSTWLWLMVLTFLPGLGFILYLFIGQDLSKKKMFKVKEEEDYCFRDIAIMQEELIDKNK